LNAVSRYQFGIESSPVSFTTGTPARKARDPLRRVGNAASACDAAALRRNKKMWCGDIIWL